MKHVRGAVVLLVVAVLACSSVVDPKSDITLLVTNSSCSTGRCDSLEVLGFPSNQPLTPGGFWSIDLGLLTTPKACFKLPPAATFRVIGVNDDGTRDTTTFTWTTVVPLALGVQAPSGFRTQASPSTTAFVPATSAGWSITLPSESHPSSGPRCGAG